MLNGVAAAEKPDVDWDGPDDLAREVYGILGIPVDAIDISGVLRNIDHASEAGTPFLISTPNLNFLVSSQTDADFRNSLLESNLCPVDGVPIVWIARLLGIPIRNRVAGSDIFERLSSRDGSSRPSRVFLFGGPPGVAQSAADALNARSKGVVCVGSHYPGFCSVEEMSGDDVIRTINASQADFLILSLGAKKGQAWLLHNHGRLKVSVRSHFGAAINFQAGTLKRAPLPIRNLGLEWLWRIKEEPHLWTRYWHDGTVLLRLLLTRVLPLAVSTLWSRHIGQSERALSIRASVNQDHTTINLCGAAVTSGVEVATKAFRNAISEGKDVLLDVSEVTSFDARFFGLILMVRKRLKARGIGLYVSGASRNSRRAFRINGFDFLLNEGGR
jgi:N-acetylglucosaminyldiphosphoundecaprenol N-acetyl-beta-D-mannosaminyltransferase